MGYILYTYCKLIIKISLQYVRFLLCLKRGEKMSVKNEIISLLEKNRDTSISGQVIADSLNVTRAAVWKAIKVLKEEGYNIDGTPNKGYILLGNNDILSSQGIACYLDEDIDIYTYKCLDSTNTQMKKLAVDGGKDHSVIIAEQQSAGRGRFGRSFYSPAKKGIYMSVLLKSCKNIHDATIITIQSAVAINRAIKRLYNLKTDIKWVNDLYYQGKKICGILTEVISDFESEMIEAIIIGIGINVSTSEFPSELQNRATSLGLNNVNRNQFIAEILRQLFSIIDEDFELVLAEYKRLSCVLDKEIEFNVKGQKYKGIVKDINDFGNFIYCSLFTALITIGAFIQIPVPYMDYFTLQFFFVLLAGILLGSKLGGLAVLLYMVIGLAGLPVFASGGGLAYVLRPSFGYLLGFIVGAYLTGLVSERVTWTPIKRYTFAVFCGLLATYFIGLSYYVGTPVSWKLVLLSCFPLDLPGDIFLSVIAIGVGVRFKKRGLGC